MALPFGERVFIRSGFAPPVPCPLFTRQDSAVFRARATRVFSAEKKFKFLDDWKTFLPSFFHSTIQVVIMAKIKKKGTGQTPSDTRLLFLTTAS
jgi:hypothetical protein